MDVLVHFPVLHKGFPDAHEKNIIFLSHEPFIVLLHYCGLFCFVKLFLVRFFYTILSFILPSFSYAFSLSFLLGKTVPGISLQLVHLRASVGRQASPLLSIPFLCLLGGVLFAASCVFHHRGKVQRSLGNSSLKNFAFRLLCSLRKRIIGNIVFRNAKEEKEAETYNSFNDLNVL